jgi:hypothetical protein
MTKRSSGPIPAGLAEQVLAQSQATHALIAAAVGEGGTIALMQHNIERLAVGQDEINIHLRELNGSKIEHAQALKNLGDDMEAVVETLNNLPCEDHGIGIAILQDRASNQLPPRELGKLEARVEAQPTAREIGRVEEWQKTAKSNWARVWEFAKYPLLLLMGALFELAVASGK